MAFNWQITKQKRAFTLAEVLITLGIIGVVAAMTIPTLVKNYQKQETVSRLQKTYSTINQAFLNSVSNLGESTSWDAPATNDYDGWNTWWDTYFLPYANLSIVKTCTGSTQYQCWSNNVKYLDGTTFAIENNYKYYVLRDGTVMCLGWGSTNGFTIVIDLNGLSKPNIVGKDIFYILIDYKNGYVQFAGKNNSRTNLLTSTTGCSSLANTSGGQGISCGALIQMDGWQIKDDYPW